jgi:hypothetical protein
VIVSLAVHSKPRASQANVDVAVHAILMREWLEGVDAVNDPGEHLPDDSIRQWVVAHHLQQQASSHASHRGSVDLL